MPESLDVAAKAADVDAVVLDWESANHVLTAKRVELIEVIREHQPNSIRGLARLVDRDVKNVMEDVKILFENHVIELEEEGNRKKPRIEHRRILVDRLLP